MRRSRRKRALCSKSSGQRSAALREQLALREQISALSSQLAGLEEQMSGDRPQQDPIARHVVASSRARNAPGPAAGKMISGRR